MTPHTFPSYHPLRPTLAFHFLLLSSLLFFFLVKSLHSSWINSNNYFPPASLTLGVQLCYNLSSSSLFFFRFSTFSFWVFPIVIAVINRNSIISFFPLSLSYTLSTWTLLSFTRSLCYLIIDHLKSIHFHLLLSSSPSLPISLYLLETCIFLQKHLGVEGILLAILQLFKHTLTLKHTHTHTQARSDTHTHANVVTQSDASAV